MFTGQSSLKGVGVPAVSARMVHTPEAGGGGPAPADPAQARVRSGTGPVISLRAGFLYFN